MKSLTVEALFAVIRSSMAMGGMEPYFIVCPKDWFSDELMSQLKHGKRAQISAPSGEGLEILTEIKDDEVKLRVMSSG